MTFAPTITRSAGRLRVLLVAAALLVTSAPALAIEAFTADYQASYMGMQATGKMTLAPEAGDRWRYTLAISNSLANLRQSTVFEDHKGQWRPVSSEDSSQVLVKRSAKNAAYDWNKGVATWGGDVKADRSGPIKLKAGDMDALLINLAVIRDAAPGQTLHYRFVDDGRMREHTYVVADELESITVAGITYNAMKATRSKDNEDTVIWVVKNVPSPIRMLKRESGKDVYALRLVEYKGVD
ncbi:MAG TPA: DUF3108 domain-containing protein [Lysobacter sp.]|nr:DUF3108 domain-containing protein [Lysobacter sp.]